MPSPQHVNLPTRDAIQRPATRGSAAFSNTRPAKAPKATHAPKSYPRTSQRKAHQNEGKSESPITTTGRVRVFDDAKGFGFVETKYGNVFVNVSVVKSRKGDGKAKLDDGADVEIAFVRPGGRRAFMATSVVQTSAPATWSPDAAASFGGSTKRADAEASNVVEGVVGVGSGVPFVAPVRSNSELLRSASAEPAPGLIVLAPTRTAAANVELGFTCNEELKVGIINVWRTNPGVKEIEFGAVDKEAENSTISSIGGPYETEGTTWCARVRAAVGAKGA